MFKLKNRLFSDQSGAASIYISLTAMFIFSLIAFSFARITQTSYADTSDSQLSLQAHYAAETALNDVRQSLVEIYYPHNTQAQGSPIPLGSGGTYRLPDLTADNFVMRALTPDRLGLATAAFDRVGLDADRGRFVVGPGGAQAKVHVFEESDGVWRERQPIEAPPAPEDTEDFGKALSLHGDALAVIARDKTATPDCDAIYLYRKGSGGWSLAHKLASPAVGGTTYCSLNSVALHPRHDSTSGELALTIGANNDLPSHQAAIIHMVQNGAVTSWQDRSSNTHPSHEIGLAGLMFTTTQQRGLAVDVVGDILVVGAPALSLYAGGVDFYMYDGVRWRRAAYGALNAPRRLLEDFGRSVSLDRIAETADKVDYILTVGHDGYKGEDSDGADLEKRGNVYRRQFSYYKNPLLPFSGRLSPQYHIYGPDDSANWLLPSRENDLGMNEPGEEYRFGKSLALRDRMMLVASNHKIYVFQPRRLQSPANRFYQRLSSGFAGECLNDPSEAPALDFDIGDDADRRNAESVGYSCVEIDLLPTSVLYDNVRSNFSVNAHLDTVRADNSLSTITQENMDDLRIIWFNPDNSLAPPYAFESANFAFPKLPSFAAWQGAGMHTPVLKVQLIPFDQEGFHRLSLLQDMKVFYLYPVKASAARRAGAYDRAETAIDYGTISNGKIYPVDCYSGEGLCDVSIVNMPNVINYLDDPNTPVDEGIPDVDPDDDSVQTLVNIASLYQETAVEVRGYFGDDSNVVFSDPNDNFNASPSAATGFLTPLYFRDIQAIVRATGYAGGGRVKVRLEERVPLRPRFELPEYGIQSAETLCKVLVGDQDSGTTTINDYSVYPWQPPDLQTLGDLDAKSNCRVY